ncbi:MAG TPA: transporter [Pyrinomonadaceae bacterium]|nr:transporter [Pyrinomonadaceae bacterium]
MRARPDVGWLTSVALLLVASVFTGQRLAQAQVRGVYPVGMSATGAGSLPDSGFSYSNLFILYSRDQFKDADGRRLPVVGSHSVLIDMNTFVWASKKKILGGARYSAAASLPISNNSLSAEGEALSGGGGFADSFYQPLILGWQTERADFKVAYGFLAPTGRFSAGKSDNVGSGYWTHVLSSGQTFYLTKNKSTAVSAFQMYEFHGAQTGTDIHPGQTLNLDYSLTQTTPLPKEMRLQLGLVGYGQWQTTDKSGPTITPEQAKAHYKVNALGFASNVILPAGKASLGFKYFREFANRSTFQGYTLQISGAIQF